MKLHKALILTLIVLLLSGCAAGGAPREDGAQAPSQSAQAEGGGLSLSRRASQPELFALEGGSCCGLYPMGEDLAVLLRSEAGWVLALFDGEELTELARRELGENPESLRLFPEGGSYCDGAEVVLLDGALGEKRRLAVPRDAVGTPVMTRAGDALYYCTETALRCLETETGITRVVRQLSGSGVTVRELLLEDTVVQCGYWDENLGARYLFLSAATGETLYEGGGELTVRTGEGRYYASFPDGAAPSLVFGVPGEEPQALYLTQPGTDCVFVPLANAAVTLTQEGRSMTLGYYDLSTGTGSEPLTLPGEGYPWYITASRAGVVWFVLYDPEYGGDVLCRWKPEEGEKTDCVGAFHTAGAPDLEGLERCGELAGRIAQRYGIRVRIWEDAVSQPPRDYSLEPEYRTELLWQQLQALDGWLGRYPEGFFTGLGGELELCLVRGITGSPESGSPEVVSGIQFWQDGRARVVLAVGGGCEGALYHELCHIIDSRVLSRSSAYDRWDQLNPGDFEYDYDYEANRQRSDYRFLQEHSRSFVDMYSMSFPKEDRARIMECAMSPGNEDLFRCPILQQKLRTMCVGIREAFGLQKSSQELAWEEYLWMPLYPQPEGE